MQLNRLHFEFLLFPSREARLHGNRYRSAWRAQNCSNYVFSSDSHQSDLCSRAAVRFDSSQTDSFPSLQSFAHVEPILLSQGSQKTCILSLLANQCIAHVPTLLILVQVWKCADWQQSTSAWSCLLRCKRLQQTSSFKQSNPCIYIYNLLPRIKCIKCIQWKAFYCHCGAFSILGWQSQRVDHRRHWHWLSTFTDAMIAIRQTPSCISRFNLVQTEKLFSVFDSSTLECLSRRLGTLGIGMTLCWTKATCTLH